MADPRFFIKTGPRPLHDLLKIAGGTEGAFFEPDIFIHDVAPLDGASAGTITFLDNVRYKDALATTRASACILSPKMADAAPPGISLILSDNPYKSYALVAQSFYPDDFPPASVSDGAHVHPGATIGAGCVVEPGAVVREGADIGAGTWVEPCAVIGPGVVLGKKCRIGANASVSHAVIGEATRLYPGVRVGQDGFGFAIDPSGHVKVPQLGRVIIGDHVEIGANTCIDRGAGPDTVIGDGTWIDNLVQIAHNVRIGKGCVIVAQAGIAGSSVVEDYVVIAAQVGVAGHLRIGKGAQIGAKAGVMRDVPPGERQLGAPAIAAKAFMRQVAALNRLTKGQKTE